MNICPSCSTAWVICRYCRQILSPNISKTLNNTVFSVPVENCIWCEKSHKISPSLTTCHICQQLQHNKIPSERQIVYDSMTYFACILCGQSADIISISNHSHDHNASPITIELDVKCQMFGFDNHQCGVCCTCKMFKKHEYSELKNTPLIIKGYITYFCRQCKNLNWNRGLYKFCVTCYMDKMTSN